MITIFSFGIDPYSLTNLSRDITPQLSNLFEVEPSDINFYASEGLFVHAGEIQNSWYTFIKVVLPKKLKIFQKEAAEIISNYYKYIVIHLEIVFEYYLEEEREVFINSEYPLYLNEKNSVVAEDEIEFDDSISEDDDDYEEDSNEDDDLFTGDAFANIRDRLGD